MQKTTGSTFGKDKYFSRKRQVKQIRFSEWVTKSNKGNNIYTKYHILIYL